MFAELCHDEVDVWAVRLPLALRDEKALAACLSEDERVQAAGFRMPAKRRQFVTGRAVLRTLLGRYLGLPASAVRLSQARQGKPSLADAHLLGFNLSHTDGLLLVAISGGVEVGVDVEHVRPVESAPQIAAHYFTARERARMLEGPMGFLQLWTCRESVVKAHGSGISAGWEWVRIVERGAGEADAIGLDTDCHVRSFIPATGYVAALAALAPSFRVRQTRTLTPHDIETLWSCQ